MRRTRNVYPRPPRSRSTRHKIAASQRAHYERVRKAVALLDRVESGAVEIRERTRVERDLEASFRALLIDDAAALHASEPEVSNVSGS